VRIDARLIDGQTDRVIWSDTWDRPIDDIAAIRSGIVDAVVDALGIPLDARSALTPVDFAAYELYLRGLFHWHRRTPQDLALAVDFFQQATRIDSTYAPTWAGLALAWAVLPALDGSSNELLDRAQDAAARALAIDSTLSDAWAARAYALHWQWRFDEADLAFRRAIALNPASSTAHQWYGEHLAKMGRAEEGERMVRRAIELDPLALVAGSDLGIVLMLDRRFDEALAQFERVNRADPAFALPFLLRHRIHLLMGNATAAEEAGRRAAELIRTFEPDDIALLSLATADTTLRAAAGAVLDRLARQPSPRWPDIAMYWALLGENDRAIDALEAALRARSPHLVQLRMAAWADPIRGDPRFHRILRQLGFP
jgi:serine/threonine-protein kinase